MLIKLIKHHSIAAIVIIIDKINQCVHYFKDRGGCAAPGLWSRPGSTQVST